MKNYALSPLIEHLTVMPSSKWKINVIFLVENCLSYNISKSGTKSITGKRDNLNWKRKKLRHQKNTFFGVQMAIWWRHNILFAKIMHVFTYPIQWLSRILNKIWGYPGFLRSYNGFSKRHVFAHFCIILPIAARADFNFDALARPYERSRVNANEWKLSIMVRGIQIMQTFWILTLSARCARAQRARGHVRTENFEML